MTAELFESMNIEVYHSFKNILSKSMLGDLLPPSCPAYFKWKHIDGGKEEETKSLRVGTAVHLLALEPEKFAGTYHIFPETYVDKNGEIKPFRKDARMKEYQNELRKAAGKICLGTEEHKQILAMGDAIRKNPVALKLLTAPGKVESSIFWEDGGLRFRCRPDFMRDDGLIVDLKTCRSANPNIFTKDAWSLHYALSAALTGRGYKALYGKEMQNYVFLCVENEAPHFISCFDSVRSFDELSGLTYLDVGNRLLDTCIQTYKDCVSSGVWPQYQGIIEPMNVPYYAKKFLEDGIL